MAYYNLVDGGKKRGLAVMSNHCQLHVCNGMSNINNLIVHFWLNRIETMINIKEKVASYVVLAVMYMFLLIVITLLGNCIY